MRHAGRPQSGPSNETGTITTTSTVKLQGVAMSSQHCFQYEQTAGELFQSWWLVACAVIGLGVFWGGLNCTRAMAQGQPGAAEAKGVGTAEQAPDSPYLRRVPAPGLEG